MKIAIVGTGYVGLVTGTCFAELGVDVTCVDTDASKIERLCRGIMPIYEPNLEELVEKNHKAGRLHFTTSLESVSSDVEIIFLAVGTPQGEDGSADLRYVLEVAKSIGSNIGGYTLVVTKSTVPVGTAAKVRAVIQQELDDRGMGDVKFDVASNPEFLKEGNAVADFMRPDRVVVGVDSQRARELMTKLYKPMLLSRFRVMFMDLASAEMTKYAANAMLATRISFINDVANLCQAVGADVNMVRAGIGADSRIGNKFLYPGCGYGGSCFPKDIKALIRSAEENGCRMEVIEAVERVNDRQKRILFDKLVTHFGGVDSLKGKRIALWGLAFKPETNDMRDAPSLVLIDQLVEVGCEVVGYDPVAMDQAREAIGVGAVGVSYSDDAYGAVLDADALVLLTEWKEFRLPNWEVVRRSMRSPVVVDGRNIFERKELEELGFDYYGIGV